MKSLSLLLISVCLIACDEIGPKDGPFTIGETTDFYFDIPRMDLDGEYEVVFDMLEQDSRCPTDYECVWEGIGIISLTITHEEEASEIVLSTFDWENYTQSVTDAGLKFTLVGLTPYPKGEELSPSKNYVASVLVESADL